MGLLKKGRVNILIDGQFGSTGKGLFAGFIANRDRGQITLAASNAGPNAGHTYIDHTRKIVAYHLPIAGIITGAPMHLCAGAVIDPVKLRQEMEEYHIPEKQVSIHRRAAVVMPEDEEYEKSDGSAQTRLASTRKGVGRALARKVMREGALASECPLLQPFIGIFEMEDQTVFMEVPQGMDLSLNYGLAYPHCTSREVSVSQALSDMGLHPIHLGHVFMTLRTLPIRVGNIGDYSSGPCWPDQEELSWESVGVEPELTTVTKRPRRIFSWSKMQMRAAMQRARPNYVFLNFAQYVPRFNLENMINQITRAAEDFEIDLKKIYTGWGPKDSDVRESWCVWRETPQWP